MKKLSTVLAILFLSVSGLSAQFSILLVDDSDDGFNHVEDFSAALDSAGYAHATFDAAGTQTLPSISMLQAYDLVIWNTGADLDNLALWSFGDSSNAALEAYMQGGGNLWLIGTDMLFDRYGAAPVTFPAGSFENQVLGIDSYDYQSYVDDGNTGVPLLDPDASSPISGLPQLDWIFSTLWYVDAVTPVLGAESVYVMGDMNYVFAGETSGLWYDNGNSRALSFFFNPSQISSFQKLQDMTTAVMLHFSSIFVSVAEAVPATLQLYPNPAQEEAKLTITTLEPGPALVAIWSMTGKKAMEVPLELHSGQQQVTLPVATLPAGIYLMRLETEHGSYPLKFVKQ